MITAAGSRRQWVLAIVLSLFPAFCPWSWASSPPAGDADIQNAVDDELMDRPDISSWNIDVRTTDGIVTLIGTVDNILAKERAEKITGTVKGVRGVVNRLDVNPPLRKDAAILDNVENAMRLDPATEPSEVRVTVNGGEVTLDGAVDSWQERKLAATVAKGVSGVRAVDNRLVVRQRSVRDDGETRTEIEQALRWDVYVDDALIDVEVEDGNVVLKGTVGSLAEKYEAGDKALVAGVSDIDNRLAVESWADKDSFREKKYVKRTDEEIENAVNDSLLYDPRVESFQIVVHSANGAVTLRGTVDNLKAKRAAAQDARNVVGVWRVENRIKVRPEETKDDVIQERVEKALLWDPYVHRYDIAVSVVDGVVYLQGEVDSTFEKALADDLASRQEGVRDVNNFLDANETTPTVYDPYSDDWYLYGYDWYDPHPSQPLTNKTDWEIEQDIRKELFWSPFVDGESVTVEVDDGVARLTGTVETWKDRRAAAENAREGGAIAVDNDLRVVYGPEYYKPKK